MGIEPTILTVDLHLSSNLTSSSFVSATNTIHRVLQNPSLVKQLDFELVCQRYKHYSSSAPKPIVYCL
ncbi:hypothetical protein D918_09170 [Trichuris suis]|nr:hypothetical protein D918_09170 [Trichuris suis]